MSNSQSIYGNKSRKPSISLNKQEKLNSKQYKLPLVNRTPSANTSLALNDADSINSNKFVMNLISYPDSGERNVLKSAPSSFSASYSSQSLIKRLYSSSNIINNSINHHEISSRDGYHELLIQKGVVFEDVLPLLLNNNPLLSIPLRKKQSDLAEMENNIKDFSITFADPKAIGRTELLIDNYERNTNKFESDDYKLIPDEIEEDIGEIIADPAVLLQEEIDLLIENRRMPLSPEELQKVDKLLNRNSFNHNVLTEKFNIDMTESKISCLKPYTWLNDEVINFYMCMLQERDEKLVELSNGNKRSSHYFNSFFIDKMLTKGEYNYNNIKRWTKKFNVFLKDKVFIPVNISNTHWTMIVVYIQLKRIHYYDSMSGEGKNKYLKHVLQWLKDESKEKYNNEYIVDNEWQLIDKEFNVPQQHNGYDCGMFSILCADFISDNIPLDNSYQQSEIVTYRKKVCAAILRGSLNF